MGTRIGAGLIPVRPRHLCPRQRGREEPLRAGRWGRSRRGRSGRGSAGARSGENGGAFLMQTRSRGWDRPGRGDTPGRPRDPRGRVAPAPPAGSELPPLAHPRGHRTPPGENIARLPLRRGRGGFPPAGPPGNEGSRARRGSGHGPSPAAGSRGSAGAGKNGGSRSLVPPTLRDPEQSCLSVPVSLYGEGPAWEGNGYRGGNQETLQLDGAARVKRGARPQRNTVRKCAFIRSLHEPFAATGRRERGRLGCARLGTGTNSSLLCSGRFSGPVRDSPNGCKGARATSELVSRDKGANRVRRIPSLRGKGVGRVSPPGPACGGASPPEPAGQGTWAGRRPERQTDRQIESEPALLGLPIARGWMSCALELCPTAHVGWARGKGCPRLLSRMCIPFLGEKNSPRPLPRLRRDSGFPPGDTSSPVLRGCLTPGRERVRSPPSPGPTHPLEPGPGRRIGPIPANLLKSPQGHQRGRGRRVTNSKVCAISICPCPDPAQQTWNRGCFLANLALKLCRGIAGLQEALGGCSSRNCWL
ncbi:collagen alpha-2(I) chain-like [Pseudopipra pipra]|uniref:collagen alpha-2(I) chain-like n=1 Tax=Pseudopipra pipra TaxID=415032 RepID=UPI003138DC89